MQFSCLGKLFFRNERCFKGMMKIDRFGYKDTQHGHIFNFS